MMTKLKRLGERKAIKQFVLSRMQIDFFKCYCNNIFIVTL